MTGEEDQPIGEGDWSYYYAALDGKPPALHSDSQVEQGYYRERPKDDRQSLPVMILFEDGVFRAWRKGVEIPGEKLADVFRRVCRNPITVEAYERFMNGDGWADEPPPMGHNRHKLDDPHDQISADLAAELEQIEEMLKAPIANQDEADRLAIWKNKVVTLLKAAEGAKKVELMPVQAEAKRIGERWGGLQATAETARDRIVAHLKPWFAKLLDLEAERQATARRNAEMLREKAKEMAAKAIDEPIENRYAALKAAHAVTAEAQAADADAAFKNPQAGRTHAKVKLVTRVKAVILEYDVVLNHLKNDSDIVSIVQRRADRAAVARNPLPGTKRVETKEPV